MILRYKKIKLVNRLNQLSCIFIDDKGNEKSFKSTSSRNFSDEWINEMKLVFANEEDEVITEQF